MNHVSPADIEEVSDLKRNPGFLQVLEFLAQARAAKFRDLAKPLPPDETATVRGFIQGLDCAIEAPANLLRQMREQIKRQPKESG